MCFPGHFTFPYKHLVERCQFTAILHLERGGHGTFYEDWDAGTSRAFQIVREFVECLQRDEVGGRLGGGALGGNGCSGTNNRVYLIKYTCVAHTPTTTPQDGLVAAAETGAPRPPTPTLMPAATASSLLAAKQDASAFTPVLPTTTHYKVSSSSLLAARQQQEGQRQDGVDEREFKGAMGLVLEDDDDDDEKTLLLPN